MRVLVATHLALLALALATVQPAKAQETVVALDVGDVTGNSGASLGEITSCFEVARGEAYTLNVVLEDSPPVVAAQFRLNFQGAVREQSVEGALLDGEVPDVNGAAIIDEAASDAVPNESGNHFVTISNDTAIQEGAAAGGSGILARLEMNAPAQSGIITLALTETVLVSADITEAPHLIQNALLAVDMACPATLPTSGPAATPAPSVPSSEDGGGLSTAAWAAIAAVVAGAVALAGAWLALRRRH